MEPSMIILSYFLAITIGIGMMFLVTKYPPILIFALFIGLVGLFTGMDGIIVVAQSFAIIFLGIIILVIISEWKNFIPNSITKSSK